MEASAGENIGLANNAYFVGRREILSWINDFLGFNYTKIEECASAAAWCQIFHAMFPECVNLSRVNFLAKHEHEFVHNWKILQAAFVKANLNKHIEMEKLIKARPLDNLEFAQWFKAYCSLHLPEDSPYDAVSERQLASQRRNKARPALAQLEEKSTNSAPPPSGSGSGAVPAVRKPLATPAPGGVTKTKGKRAGVPAAGGKAEEVKRLEEQLEAMRVNVEGLERERDFYFGKLRDIEVLCEGKEEGPFGEFVATVTKILYATDEDFVIPGEESVEDM